MRKSAFAIISFLPFWLLASCVSGTVVSSSEKSSFQESDDFSFASCSSSSGFSFEKDSPLIFNEFVSGASASDRALEIANVSSQSVSLSDYSIGIYRGNSAEITYSLFLSGFLPGKAVYVISSDSSNEALRAKANIVSSDLIDNGTFPMVLLHEGHYCDVLGIPGYQTSWGNKTSMVRKSEYQKGVSSFSAYEWLYYPCDDYSNLGDFACPLSEERVLEGPHLEEKDFALPFALNNDLGGGGAVEVSVSSYGDGDTTDFDYPSSLSSFGVYDGQPVRYENIDTPEIQHGNYIQAQPWGYAAQEFTNSKLRSARHILVQSVRNAPLTETYGRLLCFVWYSVLSSPKASDYRLLNHEIVKEGYSKIAFSGITTSLMMSDGLSYFAYLLDANFLAEKLGLKVHGEKDPGFSY